MQTASPDAAVARFREALTHVVRLRDVSLPDLIELRLAVETAAITRAAGDPVERHLDEARACLAIMSKRGVSWREFSPADVAFHAALVAASGNQALILVMQAVKDSIELHLNEAMAARSFPRLRPRIVAEHEALFDAVRRGDAAISASLLRAHVTEFYSS
jgi:DNA-binding FadR family transcriptional regulator